MQEVLKESSKYFHILTGLSHQKPKFNIVQSKAVIANDSGIDGNGNYDCKDFTVEKKGEIL